MYEDRATKVRKVMCCRNYKMLAVVSGGLGSFLHLFASLCRTKYLVALPSPSSPPKKYLQILLIVLFVVAVVVGLLLKFVLHVF